MEMSTPKCYRFKGIYLHVYPDNGKIADFGIHLYTSDDNLKIGEKIALRYKSNRKKFQKNGL